jgi:hypothetical protein
MGEIPPADFGGELRVAFLGFGVCHAEMFIGQRAKGQFFIWNRAGRGRSS